MKKPEEYAKELVDEFYSNINDYPEKSVDFFDYGYALTVHKSQGSQAKRVLLLEEPCSYWQGETWFRWLYTGVTRSEEELLIAR